MSLIKSHFIMGAFFVMSLATSSLGRAESAEFAAPETRQATMTLQNLKTLLSASRQTNESEASVNSFHSFEYNMKLSSQERSQLDKWVRETERTRQEVLKSSARAQQEQLAKLRNSRRQLHLSRMSSSGAKDEALSHALFESLLQESNVEAQQAKTMETFDEQHVVTLEFTESEGRKTVAVISTGTQVLWSLNGSSVLTQVARR